MAFTHPYNHFYKTDRSQHHPSKYSHTSDDPIPCIGLVPPAFHNPLYNHSHIGCESGSSAQKCQKEECTYRITCNICYEQGIISELTGETFKSCHQRSEEHIKGLKDKSEDNAIWKQCVTMHNKEVQSFRIDLIKLYKTDFSHQIQDTTSIGNGKIDQILNSKIEWY